MRTTLGTAAADDDVRAAIHRLGPSFERGYIAHLTLAHWADIMGEMVARRVRAVYVKDGKLTTSGSSDARQVWADADAFGKLVIEPALKEKGVSLPQ